MFNIRAYNLSRTNQVAFFDDILDHVEEVRTSSVAAVAEAKREVLQRLKEKEDRRCSELIAESLRFPEIALRRDNIEVAYNETFEWIFRDSASPFVRWLRNGFDIFWISGKAGSGKSTLMKYLSTHPGTLQILQTSSVDHQVILVDYYFWYLGTPLQKSTEGLLRSLLHQIFRARPHVIPAATPHRWAAPTSFHSKPDFWTYRELTEALRVVARTTHLDVKFCFFIDGLDEYSGDHQHLVDLLLDVVNNSSVRICASSRPWNVFDRAFGNSGNLLRLEDMTRHDIKLYVNGNLGSLPKSPEFQSLVSEIVDKAHGVFLWVYLVVCSLRRGQTEGDTISIMRRRLEKIPPDLEQYFDLILSRVDNVYSQQTAQFLKLAVLLAEAKMDEGFVQFPLQPASLVPPLPPCVGSTTSTNLNIPQTILDSFLCYYMVTQGIEDPGFAFRTQIEHFSPEQFYECGLQTKRSLMASCKDLLQLPIHKFPLIKWKGSSFDTQMLKVEFLHRTVYEFLKGDAMAPILDNRTPPHFRSQEFLHHLTLACLKYVPSNVSVLKNFHGIVQDNLEASLTTALKDDFKKVAFHYYFPGTYSQARGCDCLASFHDPEDFHFTRQACSSHRYIEERIDNHPTLVNGTLFNPWPMLCGALGLCPGQELVLSQVDPKTLAVLLENGADPNEVIPAWDQSVWHLFLREVLERSFHSQARGAQRALDYDAHHIWSIAKMLIRFGADVNAVIEIESCRAFEAVDEPRPLRDRYSLYQIIDTLVPGLLEKDLQYLRLTNDEPFDETDLFRTISGRCQFEVCEGRLRTGMPMQDLKALIKRDNLE